MNLDYGILVKSCLFLRQKISDFSSFKSVQKASKNSSNHKMLQGHAKSKDEIRRNVPRISELFCTEIFDEIANHLKHFHDIYIINIHFHRSF